MPEEAEVEVDTGVTRRRCKSRVGIRASPGAAQDRAILLSPRACANVQLRVGILEVPCHVTESNLAVTF